MTEAWFPSDLPKQQQRRVVVVVVELVGGPTKQQQHDASPKEEIRLIIATAAFDRVNEKQWENT